MSNGDEPHGLTASPAPLRFPPPESSVLGSEKDYYFPLALGVPPSLPTPSSSQQPQQPIHFCTALHPVSPNPGTSTRASWRSWSSCCCTCRHAKLARPGTAGIAGTRMQPTGVPYWIRARRRRRPTLRPWMSALYCRLIPGCCYCQRPLPPMLVLVLVLAAAVAIVAGVVAVAVVAGVVAAYGVGTTWVASGT